MSVCFKKKNIFFVVPCKFIAVILCVFSLVVCSSCGAAGFIDRAELGRRLEHRNKNFSFDRCECYTEDGIQFAYYTCGEAVILMKTAVDEKDRLSEVSLTLADKKNQAAAEMFSELACAVVDAFVTGETVEMRNALHLSDPSGLFKNETLTFEQDEYSAVLFNTEDGVMVKVCVR